MVNPGGPSKGCLTCIQRKIRCDQVRPICGQCQKSKRQCRGYRPDSDVLFRDQSQTLATKKFVKSKHQTETPCEIAASETLNFPDTANASQPRLAWTTSVTIRPLRLNVEDGLISFFANNYTCNDSNRGSNLFWMPNNFGDLLKNDVTRVSTQSVGAMALARLNRSHQYYQEAHKRYSLALLKLAETWQQRIEIDEDTTLVAILFLSFFEILTSDGNTSRQSWITHLGGLGILLKRRDEQLIQTGFGRRMLLQSRSQVILNALQTKTPVPQAFLELNRSSQHAITPPAVVLSEKANVLLMRLADLQAQFHSCGTLYHLAADLTSLDCDLDQWKQSAFPTWSFSAQSSRLPSESWWDSRCDVYSTAVMTSVWNRVRAAQIIIHDLLQEPSLQLSTRTDGQISPAVQQTNHDIVDPKMRRLVMDICASIPLYYRPASASSRYDTVQDRPLLGTIYWLLWPLEVVGSMGEAPLALKVWIRSCLQRIYETTGNVKARVAANRVRWHEEASTNLDCVTAQS